MRYIERYSSSAVSILLVVVSVLLYQLFKENLRFPLGSNLENSLIFCGVVFVSGIWVTRRSLPKSVQVLFYTCVFICTVFSLFAYPSAPSGSYLSVRRFGDFELMFLEWGRFVALAAFLIALVRPVFGIIPPLVMSGLKQAHERATDIALSPTDWLIVFETAIFLVIYLVLISFLFYFLNRYAGRFGSIAKDLSKHRSYVFNFSCLFALSIHFGNYLFSAWAKTGIGEKPLIKNAEPWSWVVENPTYYLVSNAYYLGVQPFSHYPDFVSFLYDVSSALVVPLNFAVILTQFLSLVAILNLRSSRLLTALYDLQHISIYLLTGIFFWKWIILNAGFIWALRYVEIPRSQRCAVIVLPLCILLAPHFFFIARLGWLDTPSVNRAYFQAQAEDGSIYEAPSNYLLASSITFAQQRVGRPFEAAFDTGAYGNIYDLEKARHLWLCEHGQLNEGAVIESGKLSKIVSFMDAHHRYISGNLDEAGRFSYDLYPHHIWSNPFAFEDFRQLDKRRIAGYSYVVESGCTRRFRDNRRIDVIGRWSHALQAGPR